MQRPRGRVMLAVLFALLAATAWTQVLLVVLRQAHNPLALAALQALMGTASAATAWGSWAGTRWAPLAAGLYGAVTAVMLLVLAPLIDLPPEARSGLWTGAAVVAGFAAWSAWYLRRAVSNIA